MQNIVQKKYWLILFCICAFAFVTRMYRLDAIKGYTFDEVYHAITAKLIARNDVRAYEWWNPPVEPSTAVDWLHPPLAKYTQALGIILFGENSFGWRISSVLFGVAVIFVVAEFARYLFDDRRLALLAALLSSLDGLLLTQSRIAMNDIHVTLMLLLVFFSYAWYRKTLHELTAQPQLSYKYRDTIKLSLFVTGLCVGVAMGTKWSGFFGFVVVWLFELSFFLTDLRKVAPKKADAARQILSRVLVLGVMPFVVYVLSYTHMFLQGKTLVCQGREIEQGKCYCSQTSSGWVSAMQVIAGGDPARWEKLEARAGCKRLISHFDELHKQIFWYQTNLKATHAYQSRPLDWFLDLRPVWYYVEYQEGSSTNIYAQGNPALFWIGDVAVFATLLMISMQTSLLLTTRLKRKKDEKGHELLTRVQHTLAAATNFETTLGKLVFITVAYFAVWLPWQTSPRIMFFYHYTPAVPLLAIILSYWLLKMSKWEYGKYTLICATGLIALVSVLFYPNWTGITVPQAFADIVYFGIKSWK